MLVQLTLALFYGQTNLFFPIYIKFSSFYKMINTSTSTCFLIKILKISILHFEIIKYVHNTKHNTPINFFLPNKLTKWT
jgi:hypothetical protein